MSPKKFFKFEFSRRTKILIGIFIFLLGVSGIVLFLYLTWSSMFSSNDHFRMTHLEISSANGIGWWNNNYPEVFKQLSADPKLTPEIYLRKGESNLFVLDPEKIRTTLEAVPEIERAEVSRQLPDTLKIEIYEKTPCAILRNIPPTRYISSDGTVLDGKRSIVLKGLPILYGFRSLIPVPGEKFENQQDNENVAAVLEYIELCNTDYPDIRIVTADVSARDTLTMRVIYNNKETDYFIITVQKDNPEYNLDRMVTSIRNIRRRGAPSRIINMSYSGQSVAAPTGVKQPQKNKKK